MAGRGDAQSKKDFHADALPENFAVAAAASGWDGRAKTNS